jgi:hypothetical protein
MSLLRGGRASCHSHNNGPISSKGTNEVPDEAYCSPSVVITIMILTAYRLGATVMGYSTEAFLWLYILQSVTLLPAGDFLIGF